MSTVIDVSGKLGEYMLKGWVLTDQICAKCSKVPLMRSPSPPTSYFCANCDAGPPAPSSPSLADRARQDSQSQLNEQSSPSSISSGRFSRSSTPPTEVSSMLSSPTFAPPFDAEELLRRRQQSDTASAELGRRLLKGWAMLADECPNSTCYGVPLVRPPRTGAEKDLHKECVFCGTVYVDEQGPSGSRLVPVDAANPLRRSAGQSMPEPAPSTSASTTVIPRQGKGRANDVFEPLVPQSSAETVMPSAFQVAPATSSFTPSSTTSALEASAKSLEATLHALSGRLYQLTNAPVVEPSSIAQTADTISKVTQALSQVKQLQWSESQAMSS
ncbi:hypothetical protein WOLCODRAFT_131753 [Wolfiporia cocos MD-104 SS10]|uniref:Sjogrens syndrome scleroderma autoantigen 1 family protein n=1 Tax=Wolfiporia cocos (strain MD-104) TaxID=742152 RepID=A0A2H3JWT5_WOLCO|nr:hypothetical protein WOLCODRAFT_131753 [Wolfiporia cocos MD-104 SS10]